MRFVRFLKGVAWLIVGFFVFMIILGYCMASSYAAFDPSVQAVIAEDIPLVADNFYSDSEVCPESIVQMQDFVAGLPDAVTAGFYNDWKVVVSDEMPAGLLEHAEAHAENQFVADSSLETEVGGYSNWRLRVIYVKNYTDPQKAFHVFVHELGHVFDYEFGSVSSSEEFGAIYSLYKDSFSEMDSLSTDRYAVHSQDEFFATVFKEYFLFSSHLEAAAPKAYHYFDSVYQEVSRNPDAESTMKYDLQSAIFFLNEKLAGSVNPPVQ